MDGDNLQVPLRYLWIWAEECTGVFWNTWKSSPSQDLPQWLELTFQKPAKLRMLHLVFDSDMTNPSILRPVQKGPWQLARDYKVELFDGEKWHLAVSEKDNFKRKRVHSLPEIRTEKFRATVTDSGDGKIARIIEIRAYKKRLYIQPFFVDNKFRSLYNIA